MSVDTCQDCAAAFNAEWAVFTAGCKGCWARSVAREVLRTHAARKAKHIGRETPAYADLLLRIGLTDEQVQRAARDDFVCRRSKFG